MKLSKIKRVCVDAGQLRVVDTIGNSNNLVMQWVGTKEALYPVEGVTVNEEMLQVLWELSDKTMEAMAAAPVHHDPDLLMELPGLIDKEKVESITIGKMMDYGAMKCGDGVIFVDPAMLKPCGDWLQFVIVEDEEGPWVSVYSDGKLAGLVRPVRNELAGHLLAIAQAVAGRDVVRRAEE